MFSNIFLWKFNFSWTDKQIDEIFNFPGICCSVQRNLIAFIWLNYNCCVIKKYLARKILFSRISLMRQIKEESKDCEALKQKGSGIKGPLNLVLKLKLTRGLLTVGSLNEIPQKKPQKSFFNFPTVTSCPRNHSHFLPK